MGTTTESNVTGERRESTTGLWSQLLSQPVLAVVAGTVGLGGGVGLLVVAYITVLHQLRIAPRQDAVIVAGVLSVLVVAAGLLVTQLRIGRSLARLTDAIQQSNERDEADLSALRAQTERLERATVGLQKQQQTQHGLFKPAIEIDGISTDEQLAESDTLMLFVSNRSFGPALGLSVTSSISLSGTPRGYDVSGATADCPTSNRSTTSTNTRVPPYADGVALAVDVRVGVETKAETDATPVTCHFSDAARVCHADGVESMSVAFEISYEDVFGATYTERVEIPAVELSAEHTLTAPDAEATARQ